MSVEVLGTANSGFFIGCNCIGDPPCKSGKKGANQTFKLKSTYIAHNLKYHSDLLFDPLNDIVLPKGFSISLDEEDDNIWHITRHIEENSVESYGNFKMASLTEVVGELDKKKVEEEEEDSEPGSEKPKKKVTKKPKKAVAKKDSESEPEPEKPVDEDVKKV